MILTFKESFAIFILTESNLSGDQHRLTYLKLILSLAGLAQISKFIQNIDGI